MSTLKEIDKVCTWCTRFVGLSTDEGLCLGEVQHMMDSQATPDQFTLEEMLVARHDGCKYWEQRKQIPKPSRRTHKIVKTASLSLANVSVLDATKDQKLLAALLDSIK